jgi:hypothetical protein
MVVADTEPLNSDGIVVESPNGWEIRPDGDQKLGDEAADLRLIASAPKLLAALTALLAQVETCFFDRVDPDHPMSAVHAARAAIAEAVQP